MPLNNVCGTLWNVPKRPFVIIVTTFLPFSHSVIIRHGNCIRYLLFKFYSFFFFCVFTLMLQISVNIVFTKWREVVYPENGLAFDGNNPAVNDLSSIILWVTVRNTLTQCWIVHNWFIWSHLLKYLIIVDWVGQIKILWLKLHSWNVECAISVVWC